MTPAAVMYTRVPSITPSGMIPLISRTVASPVPSEAIAIRALAGELPVQLQ